MHCQACDRENRDGARFCDSCGAALAPACSSCGTELRPDARFCDSCGTRTDAAPPTAADAERAERSPRDYTPKHLAAKILKSKSALEGERKQVTVLFADVQGSMELSEQLGAEVWHEILDRFFQILSEGVHRFEGTVNQYTGDGIMALFGAPIAHEDHAHRACFAALHLQEALREYADELRRTRGLSFSTRIGLNSGEVVVGKIGDDLRMDYTAQGHSVGLAQRMEQRAAPNSTCLTQNTARLVEGYFSLRELGDFELKGVSGVTTGYELQGLGDVRTRLDRSQARGFSRFVGRANEVATLDRALEGAVAGSGNVVGVVAQAGVGKSRLCLEFVERCRAQGIAVYEAHCLSHGRAIPLLPVLELLRGFFGLQDSDSPQLAREKITGRLMLLDRNLESLLPLAFDFLGVADPTTPPLELSAEERQRNFLQMSRQIVLARSLREPAVILIDDVHWIDPASHDFLKAIAEVTPATRTLLLLNFRPEYAADWIQNSIYQQIPLHPLGDDAVDELLEDLLGDDPSLAPLHPLVRERSGGNPFYVEEIVQTLREHGSLVGDRGSARLVTPVERLVVPATVQAILAARIDRLDEREKHLLQTAAAIGLRFPESLLRAVSPIADSELDEALRELKSGEFIFAEVLYPEAEYAFRHPLTHEVAAESQLGDQRRRVHGLVACELERADSDVTQERAALLAHHWDAADEAEPAARWHRTAAELIAGSNAAEASRHWQRVRTLAENIEDEGLAAELGQRSRLMILEYGWRLGGSEEEASTLLAEGEAWARRRDDDHALAELYNAFAMPAILVHGATQRADEVITKGLLHVAKTPDRALAFALELRRFLMCQFRGQADGMRSQLERLRTYTREEIDAASLLVGYNASALLEGYRGSPDVRDGRLAEGLAQFDKGLALARELGAREVASWLLALKAECKILAGDFVEATAHAQESLRIGEEIESPLSIGLASTYLANALIWQGRFEDAFPIAQSAVELSGRSCHSVHAEALGVLARAHLGRGDGAAAERLARRAVAEGDSLDLPIQRISTRFAFARVCAAGDEASRPLALRRLDEAEEIIRGCGARSSLAELWELRALLAALAGDEVARAEHLARSLELHTEFGSSLQIARLDALS